MADVPHITELLDLSDVVDAVSIAYIRVHATPQLGPEHLDSDIRGMIHALDPVERQEFRTLILRTVYAAARPIAEQAYARAWSDAEGVGDELTAENIANPFAEGAVIV